MNLPKTDWVKIVSSCIVMVVVIPYCIMGFLKHLKFKKMLEKAAGKGGAAALRDKMLPDDLRKKLGDVAGFSWIKALLTFSLSLCFVMTMAMMP